MTARRLTSAALPTLVLAALALTPAGPRGQEAHATRGDRPSIDDPQLSPDGRTIAFVIATSDRAYGRTTGIHRLDAASGRETPLTTGAGHAWSPRWSPDGRRLAFLSARGPDGPPQIHVLEIESGALHQVTRHPTPPGDLTWAPDSRLIFFTAADATSSDRRHLSVVDLDGVTTQITFGAYAILDYALSPSGSSIAMTRAPSALVRGRRERDVWVMDANGGNAHRLTTGAEQARLPQVSPDGETVAFLAPRRADARGTAGATVFVVARRGGAPRVLLGDATFAVRAAQWLSDDRIAFVAEHDGVAQLMALDVEGGHIDARTPEVRGLGHWSLHRRTGTQVFTAQVPGVGLEIFLLAPGAPVRQVSRRP